MGVLVVAGTAGMVHLPAIAAQPSDLPDAILTLRLDPLLTRPAVLDSGVTLPGDTQVLPCAVRLVPAGGVLPALSLADAVEVALCRNPQAQSAWDAIKVQAAALGEARAAYFPVVTFSASRVNDQTRYPGSHPAGSAAAVSNAATSNAAGSNTAATSLNSNTLYGSLNWRLFDFGARDANQRSANALLTAALVNHDAVLQKILGDVVTAYFDAQTALATSTARQKNEEVARQTLEAAQRREARGVGAQSDTLQAATSLAKARLEKSRAQGAYGKSMSVLIYALGVPAGTPLALAQDMVAAQGDLRQDLHDWLAQTQALHPTLLAGRAQLASARDKVVATQAEGMPTLDLTGSLFQNGRPNQGLTSVRTREILTGVTLNIPIFDGFARTYKVRGAQAQVEQKQAQLQDTENQVLMEVVKAHADARAALENLGASQDLLGAAQDALASVQRKFDRGAADILELLSTQSALSDAQLERVRCLSDWRSSRLRLLASAGMLGRGQVQSMTQSSELPASGSARP
ncbi:cyclolysin secretion protein CyaE [soil metagenome]